MKIKYFPETDTLAIELTRNPVVATDVISEDLILDYDEQGKIVAITLDNWSQNVEEVDLSLYGSGWYPIESGRDCVRFYR